MGLKVGDEVCYKVNACLYNISKINEDGTLEIENEFEVFNSVPISEVIFV